MNNLLDALQEKYILLNAKATDWQDAIRIAGNLMVQHGAVTEHYVDAMIQAVEAVGPYILIAPELAMPHARPEDGVKEVAMTLVTLENPVYFDGKEDFPVYCVMALAAVDKKAHLGVLRDFAQLVGEDDFVPEVRKKATIEEVVQLIQERIA